MPDVLKLVLASGAVLALLVLLAWPLHRLRVRQVDAIWRDLERASVELGMALSGPGRTASGVYCLATLSGSVSGRAVEVARLHDDAYTITVDVPGLPAGTALSAGQARDPEEAPPPVAAALAHLDPETRRELAHILATPAARLADGRLETWWPGAARDLAVEVRRRVALAEALDQAFLVTGPTDAQGM